MASERKDLATALANSIKAIDDDYKEEMRELRALFEEAKEEAAKDEPDGVKLKALLGDANEMVKTFAGLYRCGRAYSAWPGCSDCSKKVAAMRSRPRRPLGSPLPPRVRDARRRRHHGDHGGAALCQPRADHDRRRRPRRIEALLQIPLHRRQSARHRAQADQPHGRRRPARRRDDLPLHPHQRDRLDAAGHRADRRAVEVPLVAIVRFADDKVAHEHIYWDQASVLVQVGLLDPKGLPVAGIETARKVADNALPSNGLMTRWAASAGKPIYENPPMHPWLQPWPPGPVVLPCSMASTPCRSMSAAPRSSRAARAMAGRCCCCTAFPRRT